MATCQVFLLKLIKRKFIFQIYCRFSLSTMPVPVVTMSGSSKNRKMDEIFNIEYTCCEGKQGKTSYPLVKEEL